MPKSKTGPFPILLRRLPARSRPPGAAARHRGVVLIVALVMLVVISLLATLSMRNAVSTEKVSGTVRTTELATQAAEIALRHCEQSVVQIMVSASGGTTTFSTTFTASNILPVNSTPLWQSTTVWDSTSTATYVLPLALVNQALLTPTYRRPPECMVGPVPLLLPGAAAASTTASFVITARGFGPEVAPADANRSRPVGSEVWLQSHIELQ
jgi:type IV pilus assembly protein PilX